MANAQGNDDDMVAIISVQFEIGEFIFIFIAISLRDKLWC